MKREIAEAWVKALRSGDYRQDSGCLRNGNNGFCCLGVLCDLAAKEGVDAWSEVPDFFYRYSFGEKNERVLAVLSDSVKNWAGMASDKGDRPNFPARNLLMLNDFGESFSEIADIIEREWEQL